MLRKASFADLYKAERDYIVRSVHAKLAEERDLTLDDNPGKEFQVAYSRGGTLIGRIYLVQGKPNDRLYILLVAGSRVKAGQGDAAKFLDSFQLTADSPREATEAGTGAKPGAKDAGKP